MEAIDFCCDYLRKTAPEILNPVPIVTGDDLVSIGMRPGPVFKQILEQIRDAQLNLEIVTRSEGLSLAQSLVRQ